MSAFAEPGAGWELSQRNPLVSPGRLGEWDDFKVGSPSVIFENGEQRMWFRGCHFVGNDYGCAIGLATSKDGSTWEKVLAPVHTIEDPSERRGLHTVAVLKVEGQYLMYYSVSADPFGGRTYPRIYLATSPDGIAWKKEGAVLRAIHKYTFSIAHTVLHDGSLFHLWYLDAPQSKGEIALLHVTSSDGKAWNVAGFANIELLHLAHLGMGTSRIAFLRGNSGSYLGYSALSEEHAKILRSSDGTFWNAGDGKEIVLTKGTSLEAPAFLGTSAGIAAYFVIKSENGAESIGSAILSGSIFK